MIIRLNKRLFKEWRRLATGVCFLTFMTCGLIFSLVVIPPLRLLPIGDLRRRRLGQGMVHRCFALFMNYMGWLSPIASFRIGGLEHLKDLGPCLLIANHPTLIDVVAILGQVPRSNCLVKGALFRDPRFAGMLRTAGFLPNDSGNAFLENVSRNFSEGFSLLIFPEGTRSPKVGLHPFTRGAAQVAARNDVPIVPILVNCTPRTLTKGRPWYDVPERPMAFELQFQKSLVIPPEITEIIEMPLKARALNRFFEKYFRETLGEKHQENMA